MRTLKMVGMAFLLVLVSAGAVVAAEHGGGDSSKWLNLLYRFINFVILAWIIYKVAGKRLAEFFSGRRYQIETDLKDMDARKDEAAKKLSDVEASIANLEAEKAKIIEEAEAQGNALKQAIIDQANATADQIKAQAKVAAEQEAKLAVESIKAEMAESIADAAELMVQKQLKKKDHEGLINEYLTKVVLN
ncbi:F0F1 ATP synthase subunit B family protein [Desulfoplanes sp.]